MVTTPIRQIEPQATADEGAGSGLEPIGEIAALAPAEDGGWELPSEFLLGTLGDGRLRVTSPIEVRTSSENGDVVCEAWEVSEFGFGTTRSEAVRNLQRAIVELYFSLEENEQRLGNDLKQTLAVLRSKLSPR